MSIINGRGHSFKMLIDAVIAGDRPTITGSFTACPVCAVSDQVGQRPPAGRVSLDHMQKIIIHLCILEEEEEDEDEEVEEEQEC